jgi:hypothetical protein
MPLDLNELLTEGPFAGLTVGQMQDYATSLKQAVEAGTQPPAPPAPPATPPKKTPAEVLAEHSADRVDNATLLTWARLEQDDEASFSASVADYEKYKTQIDELKKNMHPAQRIVRGFHRTLYEHFRMKDPAIQKAIYGTAPDPEPPPESEEERVAREAAEALEEANRAAAPPAPPAPARPAPRAVPPAAPPTPGARAAAPPPGPKKPKLVANEKIIKAARAWGVTTDEYLLSLEERGFTQQQIEEQSAPRVESQQFRSSAYGRTRTR